MIMISLIFVILLKFSVGVLLRCVRLKERYFYGSKYIDLKDFDFVDVLIEMLIY